MRLRHWMSAVALLSASTGAWADLITFSDLHKPAHTPAVYAGFEISPAANTDSTAGILDAAGTQMLEPGNGSFLLRASVPYYLESLHLSQLTSFFGSSNLVTLLGYNNGVQVASASILIGPWSGVATEGFKWYDLAAYSGWNTAVDTLVFSGNGSTSGPQFGLDALNIRPVPEPETWALMGMGLVGLTAAARRRQQQRG